MKVTFHEDVVFNGPDEPNKMGKWSQFVHDLKQQRLEGKYPLVTRKHAISTTAFFGLLFIGISLLLKSANRQVILIRRRYDHLADGTIHFEIKRYIPPPVYFYYELENTFMMHRSLNGAFCEAQLTGSFWDDNYRYRCDTFKNNRYSCEHPHYPTFFWFPKYCVNNQVFYAPIGGAASIMFNDSFVLSRDGEVITWTEKGVISERRREKFLEPEEGTDNLCAAKMFMNTSKPRGWTRHVCEMGGYRNSSLIKWLEPSTSKNFKKLYRILDTGNDDRGLLIGNYTLYTNNIYWPPYSNSPEYKMKKYFWILHPSWVGTEQKFLEIMYLIVGIGLLALACFLVGFQIFMMNRRKKYSSEK